VTATSQDRTARVVISRTNELEEIEADDKEFVLFCVVSYIVRSVQGQSSLAFMCSLFFLGSVGHFFWSVQGVVESL
jgi:hypothetical protein